MARDVADTDVLIDCLAGREPSAGAVLKARARDALATTTVTRYEIPAGARYDAERLTCLKRLDAIRTLPLDPVAADRAARVFRALEDSGRRIEPGACLIAGITLHHGGSLLTRYTKHVERVEGLTLA